MACAEIAENSGNYGWYHPSPSLGGASISGPFPKLLGWVFYRNHHIDEVFLVSKQSPLSYSLPWLRLGRRERLNGRMNQEESPKVVRSRQHLCPSKLEATFQERSDSKRCSAL